MCNTRYEIRKMATVIAISGKGGSGKTTLAAMIIRSLIEQADRNAVLVVDADPNACLGLTLGVEVTGSIADIRETKPVNSGMDRLRSFEYNMQQAITEADGFDLLTMGHPEGPGCYCAANNILRTFMDKLSSAYGYVVVDNEAGMEHLSRRTTNNVDLLCIVAEATSIGVITARRIFELAKQLPIVVKRAGIIWNKADSGQRLADSEKELNAIETFGHVPYDEAICEASMQSKTVFELADDSFAFSAVRRILEEIVVLQRKLRFY